MFAQHLVYKLRSQEVSADKDHMGKSLKAQMKYADKMGYTYIIVLGDEEIDSNKAVLKNMKTGEQKDISIDSIIDRMKIQG